MWAGRAMKALISDDPVESRFWSAQSSWSRAEGYFEGTLSGRATSMSAHMPTWCLRVHALAGVVPWPLKLPAFVSSNLRVLIFRLGRVNVAALVGVCRMRCMGYQV